MSDITYELASELFEYRDGDLYRKISVNPKLRIGSKAGTLHNGYVRLRIERKAYLAHRIVFLMFNGYVPKYIDHLNGDKSDNRIENLRECTVKQNQQNTGLRKDNASGTKGVRWYAPNQTWLVQIDRKHIGYYKDRELADLVAFEYRILRHQEFARTL